MRRSDDPGFHSRVVATVAATVLLFALFQHVVFVMPNPARAAANWNANFGGLMFFTSIAFFMYGVPAGFVIYVILLYAGPWKKKRS